MDSVQAHEIDQSNRRSAEPDPPPATSAGDDTQAWRVPGAVAGVAGAAAVAVVFLVLDLGSGRPLWTPSAMGSLLFRGESLAPDASWVPVFALGYTLVHGTLFLGIGTVAAQLLASVEGERGRFWASQLGLGTLLFIAFELSFLAFAVLFDAELVSRLGAGPVAVANLAAAAVMAGVLSKQL